MFDFFVDLPISFWVIAATRVRSIISLCISNTYAGNSGPIVHFDSINCSLHEGQRVVHKNERSTSYWKFDSLLVQFDNL